MDCEATMPGFPTEDNFPDDWQPAADWKHFTDHHGDIVGWQCPECDAKEQKA